LIFDRETGKDASLLLNELKGNVLTWLNTGWDFRAGADKLYGGNAGAFKLEPLYSN
jgi:hypothetical protein